MKGADIDEFFRRFEAAKPAPKGELGYVNPYTLLVAVVLSFAGRLAAQAA